MHFWVYLGYRGLLRALGGFSALMVLLAAPGLLASFSIGHLPHATVFYLLLTLAGCAVIFKKFRPAWMGRPLGWRQGMLVCLVLVVVGFAAGELATKAVAMSGMDTAKAHQMTQVLWLVSMMLGTTAGVTGILVSLFKDVSGSRAMFGQPG